MVDLEAYLKAARAAVDSALDGHLPPEDEAPARLHKAMRYSVFSGGKRLRPILCLAAADALGAAPEAAMTPAVSLELLHTYTLIHDDLPCMDDDSLRRGRPTTHVVFGEADALLAGDALLTRAFEVLGAANAPDRYPASRMVVELAHAAGSMGVVGGQAADLAAQAGPLDREGIEFIHRRKTGALFRVSLRLGAMAAAADAAQLEALSACGDHLGWAFQIADDLLDASADAGAGKPPRGQQGRPAEATSCLRVYRREEALDMAHGLLAAAVTAIGTLNKDRSAPLLALAKYLITRSH